MSCFSKRCKNNHKAFAEVTKWTEKITVKIIREIGKNTQEELKKSV